MASHTITTVVKATASDGYTGGSISPPYSPATIAPLMTGGSEPTLAAVLPGINSTGSNYTTTQGQGSSSVTANRHFRMHCGDWGKFFLGTYKTLAVNYRVVIERIDGSEDIVWDDNVKGLEEAGFSIGSNADPSAAHTGEAGYQFKLRVDDTLHFEVTSTDTSQQMGLHLSDEDAAPKIFVGQKTLISGLEMNVPIGKAHSNVFNLYGVCSAMWTGSSLEIEHPVEAVA